MYGLCLEHFFFLPDEHLTRDKDSICFATLYLYLHYIKGKGIETCTVNKAFGLHVFSSGKNVLNY